MALSIWVFITRHSLAMKKEKQTMLRTAGLVSKHPFELEFLRRLADVVVLGAAALFSSHVSFGTALEKTGEIHMLLLYLCTVLAFFTFPKSGMYDSWRGRFIPFMLGRLITSWAMVLLTGLFFSFLIHRAGELSRLWLFCWYVTGVIFLGLFRIVFYVCLHFLRRQGFNIKRVVIVGYGHTGQEMHRRSMQHDRFGYDVVGIHVDQHDEATLVMPAVAQLTTLAEIHDFVVAQKVHEIWITLSISASAQLQELQYLLRNSLVDIRWVHDTLGLQMLSNRTADFLGLPTVDLNRPISDGLRGSVKHLLDKLFAAMVLLLMSPLFMLIALAIKVSSPGTVFFKQARLGLNGKPFMVYKFRTMKAHQQDSNVIQATKNDPRITAVGQLLRRTSVDELPQFINVLLGEMSVVGPRPHALSHNAMYEEILELYMARHRVRPGITGWAQIHGLRGEIDSVDKMEKRVQFDLYYIQNWSLLMDMRILVWTTFKGWTGKNAY